MGPEGKATADLRADALSSWKVRPEPETGHESLVKTLLPLVLAQGMDLLTTENLIAQPAAYGVNQFERNPLPGMGSSLGRLGWGALETALAAAVMRKAPKIGRPARNALVGIHSGLARGNQSLTDEEQDKMRTKAWMR